MATSAAASSSTTNLQQQQHPQMGTKRNRVLTRQPRVKRDSDSLSNNQISPEPSAALDFDPFGSVGSSLGSVHVAYPNSSSHHHLHLQHHQHHQLLAVPPRIERHASEPAPSMTPSSPSFLSVPQSTPYLMKQHSDPLLPSQHAALSAAISGSTNPFAPLHRQYSHPLSGSNSHVTSAPLQISHHISLPESIYASGSPPPAGSSHYLVPQSGFSTVPGAGAGSHEACTPATSATTATITTSTDSGIAMTPTKTSTLPQLTTTYVAGDTGRSNSPPVLPVMAERSVAAANSTPSTKFRSSKSASGSLLSERISSSSCSNLQPGALAMTSSSFEHIPTLRVKNEELQRSVSSPQTSREIITLENPRSSHCPVIRPGPALGCNFCWNTIDGHGRILRRKTKYHCPECQTNLCIVPCFQEYHERLNNEAAVTATTNATSASCSDSGGKHYSGASAGGSGGGGSSSGSGGSTARHYTKTETI